MSKQSKAKEDQQYVKEGPTCSTCKNFSSKIEMVDKGYGEYEKESNMRCSIGLFAVKKRGYCKEHCSGLK